MRFEQSRQLFERARKVIPSGVTSCMRTFQKPVPLFIDRGHGSRVVDVDGNEYIDYSLAHGPLILGHCHPHVTGAVERQIRRGSTFGCQHELEPAVAEAMLGALPWAERVVFSNTGTEAVQVALRLARAATERNIVLKFEGDYHGWLDSVLVGHRHPQPLQRASREPALLGTGGQVSSILQDILVVPWNAPEVLREVFAEMGGRIAAVITEPMLCNLASIQPRPGFLSLLRELTRQHGSLLIFDEVVTGFRLAPGGAAEHFAVAPDLAVFGKAIAGGYPLSAVAGSARVLAAVEDGRVRHFGTFNGNPVAMAAARATLEVLLDPAAGVYPRMQRLGQQLMDGLRTLGSGRRPWRVQGVPACFHLVFSPQCEVADYAGFLDIDARRTGLWVERALAEGIFQMGDARFYLSGVHTEEDVALTLHRAARVIECLDLK